MESLESNYDTAFENKQYQQAFDYSRSIFTYLELYLNRFALEEFTIEKKLFLMWEARELKFVENFHTLSYFFLLEIQFRDLLEEFHEKCSTN